MTTKAVPRIENRPAQSCVSIPIEASLQEWNRTIEAIPRLFAWLGEQNVTPAGALFYRYRTIGDMESPIEVEIGISVQDPVTSSGEVVAGTIPGGTYAAYVHHGHPDEIFRINQEIEAWAAENGINFDVTREGERDVWAGRFEFFLTNPEDEPDPSNWQTEIAYLIKSE